MCIDLHIHTLASDGLNSVQEIFQRAEQLNLKAIAITDHDTLVGVKEALEEQHKYSIAFLTGVEISASAPSGFDCSGSFHILGYGINTDSLELQDALSYLQQQRMDRIPYMISRLHEIGMDISYHDVLMESGHLQAGRPHIARALIKKGYVASINEAFDRYLAKGKPAYVEKYRLSCEKAFQLIKNAGGIPVLAHPYLLGIYDKNVFNQLIQVVIPMGLMGIEAYYTNHTHEWTEYYNSVAQHHKLLVTGGSDFHGEPSDDIEIGKGR
ncbi:MAG: PHP domain-containing protein, partial [Desulfobacterales bacterium]|nr:PHP domain-containing protein [Desulfobacterales bacterium]